MKASFRRLLLKEDGNRATWEYPFAVAGINVSFMLIQMLDLNAGMHQHFSTQKPFVALTRIHYIGRAFICVYKNYLLYQ